MRSAVAAAVVAFAAATVAPAVTAGSCAGDCNDDGEVTITDTIVLVNVALGVVDITQCPAGDRNQDGTVTVNEIVLAVSHALGGCPPAGTVVIRFGAVGGLPGSAITVPFTLATGGNTVIATINEIYFSPTAQVAARSNGKPDCLPNVSLGKDLTAFAYIPTGCAPGSTCTGIRALVLGGPGGSPDAPIPDGATLYTCRVTVAAVTPPDARPLTCVPRDQPDAAPYAYYTTAAREDRPAGCEGSQLLVSQDVGVR